MTNPVQNVWRVRLLGVRVLFLIPALGYFAWQADTVPDYVPILGWVDDALFIALLVLMGRH